MPTDFYNLNTFYGSEEELKECVKTLNEKSITAVADIVINHRCATQQDEQGRWNIYEGKLAWDQSAICSGNPAFGGTGNPKTGGRLRSGAEHRPQKRVHPKRHKRVAKLFER